MAISRTARKRMGRRAKVMKAANGPMRRLRCLPFSSPLRTAVGSATQRAAVATSDIAMLDVREDGDGRAA